MAWDLVKAEYLRRLLETERSGMLTNELAQLRARRRPAARALEQAVAGRFQELVGSGGMIDDFAFGASGAWTEQSASAPEDHDLLDDIDPADMRAIPSPRVVVLQPGVRLYRLHNFRNTKSRFGGWWFDSTLFDAAVRYAREGSDPLPASGGAEATPRHTAGTNVGRRFALHHYLRDKLSVLYGWHAEGTCDLVGLRVTAALPVIRGIGRPFSEGKGLWEWNARAAQYYLPLVPERDVRDVHFRQRDLVVT